MGQLPTQRRSIPSVLVDPNSISGASALSGELNYLSLKDCFGRRSSTGRALPKIPVEQVRKFMTIEILLHPVIRVPVLDTHLQNRFQSVKPNEWQERRDGDEIRFMFRFIKFIMLCTFLSIFEVMFIFPESLTVRLHFPGITLSRQSQTYIHMILGCPSRIK